MRKKLIDRERNSPLVRQKVFAILERLQLKRISNPASNSFREKKELYGEKLASEI